MRVDLAAAHRLAFAHNFSEGIFTHLTCTVPEVRSLSPDPVRPALVRDYGGAPSWRSAMTARSCRARARSEESGFCIDAPIDRLHPRRGAARRTPTCLSQVRSRGWRIRRSSRSGRPNVPDEACRLRRALIPGGVRPGRGRAARARARRQEGDAHGETMARSTVGRSVAEAYDLLYYLECVAQVQLYAMWTGEKLKTPAAGRRTRRCARSADRCTAASRTGSITSTPSSACSTAQLDHPELSAREDHRPRRSDLMRVAERGP